MKKGCNLVFVLTSAFFFAGCLGAIDSISRKELSGGYIYYESGGFSYIEKANSRKGIPGYVFQYNYNNEFIIATEKSVDISDLKQDELFSKGELYDYINKNGQTKYWIIVHESDSIYGPYFKGAYQMKLKDLGVPNELKLE